MVVLSRIYTRTGDLGETGLGDMSRVAKDHARVEAYGSVDETNAALGLARLHATDAMDAVLARIQNDLFDLGADLCTPLSDKDLGYEPLRMIEGQVTWLERQIDLWNADLKPLRSFVLPAGSPLATHLHLARTICRRAERAIVTLSHLEPLSDPTLRYVNRLSDLLFVLSRAANQGGAGDVLWVPGAGRQDATSS